MQLSSGEDLSGSRSRSNFSRLASHTQGLKLTAQMRPPCDALACSVTSVAAGGFSGLIIMMDAAAAVPVTQSCIFHQQGTGDAKQEPPRSSKVFFGCHTWKAFQTVPWTWCRWRASQRTIHMYSACWSVAPRGVVVEFDGAWHPQHGTLQQQQQHPAVAAPQASRLGCCYANQLHMLLLLLLFVAAAVSDAAML